MSYNSITNTTNFFGGDIDVLSVTAKTVASDFFIAGIDGNATLPPFTFISSQNTGIYSSALNNIDFTTNGVQRLNISTTGVNFYLPVSFSNVLSGIGSASAPGFSFSSDTNTGMYSSAADNIDFTTNGINRLNISTAAITSTLPLLIPIGSQSAPSYSFSSDSTTGVYSSGSGKVSITCSGTQVLDITNSISTMTGDLNLRNNMLLQTTTNSAILFMRQNSGSYYWGITSALADSNYLKFNRYVGSTILGCALKISPVTGQCEFENQIYLPAGILPAYSFVGNSNTGMYSSTTNNVDFVTNSVNRLNISTTYITSTLAHLNPTGAVGSPSYSFTGNSVTGMYSSASNNIDFSTNSTRVVNIGTSLTAFSQINSAQASASFNLQNASSSNNWVIQNDNSSSDAFKILRYNPTGSLAGTSLSFAKSNGNAIFEGSVQVKDGSSSSPGLCFSATNSGIYYSSGSSTVNFTIGGSLVCFYSTNYHRIPSGNNSTPGMAFLTDSSTGIYNSASGLVDIGCSGTNIATFQNSSSGPNLNIIQPNSTGEGIKVNTTHASYADSAIWSNATRGSSSAFRHLDLRSNGSLVAAIDGQGVYQSYGGLYYVIKDEYPGVVFQNASTLARWYLYHNEVANGQNLILSSYNNAGSFQYNAFQVFRDGSGMQFGNNIFPDTDNAYTCGKSGKRFSSIWSANNVIQTSDERMKDDIQDETLGCDFISKLRPVSYRWKDETVTKIIDIPPDPSDPESKAQQISMDIEQKHVRRHHGLLAQQVKSVMDDMKLNATDCAFYIDNQVNEPNEEQRLGLNYSEFNAILIKCIKELIQKNSDLENRISALEGEIVH